MDLIVSLEESAVAASDVFAEVLIVVLQFLVEVVGVGRGLLAVIFEVVFFVLCFLEIFTWVVLVIFEVVVIITVLVHIFIIFFFIFGVIVLAGLVRGVLGVVVLVDHGFLGGRRCGFSSFLLVLGIF